VVAGSRPASEAARMAGSVPQLTPQEQTFVEEYCKDRNVVRAALAAGLSDNYFAASTAGHRLLKTVQIRAAVKAVLRVQARRLKAEVPDVVREWAILAKSDLDDYEVDAGGRLRPRPGVPRSALRAVKKFKQTRTERLRGSGDAQELTVEIRTEIELHGKEGPLAKLYEHLHGVLPGEQKATELTVESAAALLAALGSRRPQPGGGGGTAGGAAPADPVVPERRSAE
jgi:phage terminase small subunit